MNNKFIKLPILDNIVNTMPLIGENLERVAIISVQHLLETTGSMFESFLEMGFKSDQIFVTGKLYSNNQRTIDKLQKIGIYVLPSQDSNQLGNYYKLLEQDCRLLWDQFRTAMEAKDIETVIILDDGGMLLKTVPEKILLKYKTIGIEQTSSGVKLNRRTSLSIINVARSAAKTQVEPAFISQAVIQKARMDLLKFRPKSIGIIGFGIIGRGLYNDLKKKYCVKVYDSEEIMEQTNPPIICSSLEDIYNTSDIVIGATGSDVSSFNFLNEMTTDKILISVSSGDIEFKSLLQDCQNKFNFQVNSILDDVIIKTSKGHNLTFLRGGTPANFDNNIHSVFPEYIQLTRGLLTLAVIQAIRDKETLSNTQGMIKLNPKEQLDLLKNFDKEVYLGKFEFLTPFQKLMDLQVISQLSEGKELN